MKARRGSKDNNRTYIFCDVCEEEIKEDYFILMKQTYRSNHAKKMVDMCNKCCKEEKK